MSSNHQHNGLRNIRFAFALNLFFAIFEFIGGIWTNSLALTSDAVHDFGDCVSLGTSYFLEKVSKKKRDKKFSYGYKRFSLLAAFINSAVLLIGTFFVLSKAIPRLFAPEHFNAQGVFVFALVGILVNGIAAFRLKRGSSLNERAVSWHLLEDVFGWIAVLIVSVFSLIADIHILDPILSILISLYVLYNVLRNLKTTTFIFLQGTPLDINQTEIDRDICAISGVQRVHDLHVWTLDGENNIVTIHVVVKKDVSPRDLIDIKCQAKIIFEKHGILHSTIELEQEGEACLLQESGH